MYVSANRPNNLTASSGSIAFCCDSAQSESVSVLDMLRIEVEGDWRDFAKARRCGGGGPTKVARPIAAFKFNRNSSFIYQVVVGGLSVFWPNVKK